MAIHFENWKGKRVVVIRNHDGKIITWRKAKYKDSKESVRREVGERGTFTPGIKRHVERFASGTREVSVTTKSKIDIKDGVVRSITRKTHNLRIDDGRVVQYVFSGKLNGQTIHARSKTYTSPSKSDLNDAREEAFENFIFRLSNPIGEGGYDEDEGKRIFETGVVKHTHEGVVFYSNSDKNKTFPSQIY